MSYTALYRKFRPGTFRDVKGQDHIATTLCNQVAAGRIGHAYLFTGTRGTGKTTAAKIFARMVNCENPDEYGPCGQCPTCKAIAAGASMNVIEIDAASNNGVDNVREIIDEVSYSPAEGKYKVYIIDEVHMLSTGAFNALLKTLEEPPSYVIFILATTEVHKLPITVLSRCQRYDFKRISIDTITARMEELIKIEEVEIEERALRYIAKVADGSMRDALSLLDQCIAFHLGQELTYDKVLEVLGAVDTEVFSKLLRCVIKQNVQGCIEILDEVTNQGRELVQFVTDFTWYLRNLMLVQASDKMEELVDMSSENLAHLKEEAGLLEPAQIMRYIHIFSELCGQIRYANQKRILLEIALIKLCKPQMETDPDSLVDRVRQVEEKLEQGIQVVQTVEVPARQEGPVKEKPKLPDALPDDIREIASRWKAIVDQSSGIMKTILKNVIPSLGNDNKLMIVDKGSSGFTYFENTEHGLAHRAEFEEFLKNVTGKEFQITYEMASSEREFDNSYIDISKDFDFGDMEVTVEDEDSEQF